MPGELRTGSARPDCLFIHAGRYAGGRRDILLLPLGTLTLADRLRRLGFTAEALNAALLPDPLAGAVRAASRKKPALLCLDLHWHQQTADVLELCGELKKKLPATPIVLGGYTASFFAEEAMAAVTAADYLIKGDADEALPALLGALLQGRKPAGIPNLYAREAGRIVPPAALRPAAERALAGGSSTRYSCLVNRDDHLGLGRENSLPEKAFRGRRMEEPSAYLCVGRGCARACSYCGGGAGAQRLLNSRERPFFRKKSALLEEMRELSLRGISRVYLSYDPPGAEAFYASLFRDMRRAGLTFSAAFECWGLPSGRFITDFARTFGKGSRLVLSPDCGSRKVRALNGRGSWSNADLERTVLAIGRAGLGLQLDFTSGLPFETRKDFSATLALIARLRGKARFDVSAGAIEIEPASPMFLRPEKYGVTVSRGKLGDFISAAKKRSGLGYATRAFTEKEIISNVARIRRAGTGRRARPVAR